KAEIRALRRAYPARPSYLCSLQSAAHTPPRRADQVRQQMAHHSPSTAQIGHSHARLDARLEEDSPCAGAIKTVKDPEAVSRSFSGSKNVFAFDFTYRVHRFSCCLLVQSVFKNAIRALRSPSESFSPNACPFTARWATPAPRKPVGT